MKPLVLRCSSLSDALSELQSAEYLLDAICPADGPTVAVLSRAGRIIHLVQDGNAEETELAVKIVTESDPPLPEIKQKYEIRRAPKTEEQGDEGRAGMIYTDLLPDRLGGRLIASLIEIPKGGPVNDYVHHHRTRFQIIYCRSGWVKVVYENNGEPFLMKPGDCVLQPPGIRHRVLEASPGLQVVELASPAIHATFADRTMDLPNGVLDAERLYGGQKFVRHVAEGIVKKVSGGAFRDWLERDTGIGKATAGLASVVVRRPSPNRVPLKHSGELLFWFVLEGAVQLRRGKSVNRLESGDSVAIPPDMEISALGARTGTEILEVRFPAVAL